MFKRGWLALLPIWLWTLSGCTWMTATTDHASWLKRFNNHSISPDHALIEVALIERPLGDAYANHGLWQHTDELIVNDLERRGTLDDNGLRIGQLVGSPPNDFQQMLLSKQYCSNPQALIFPSGKIVPIYLGPPCETISYVLALADNRSEIAHEHGRFCLDVTAHFASDGRTKLSFVPKVETGEATLPFHAVPDQSTWELKVEKACKKYPELGWDVTLGPNQFLVIGGRMERARSWGQTAFTQQEALISIQRLLVIRNCRSIGATDTQQQTAEELARTAKSPPLAIQASMPAFRAKSN